MFNKFADAEFGGALRNLFRVLLILLVAFGVNLTQEQVGAILLVVEASLFLLVKAKTADKF